MLTKLRHLYERALGGPDVAASPNLETSGFWPEGQPNVAVSEARVWIQNSLDKGNQFFFFLVGGPGGGKSHISRSIVSGFQELNPSSSSLAERSHQYRAGNQNVLLINDATIKPDNSSNSALSDEIAECISNGTNLIACVNRGVFVEEIANTENVGISQLLGWIQSSTKGEELGSLKVRATTSYLSFGTFSLSNSKEIEICIIYVDACSLFEKTPEMQFTLNSNGESTFSGSEYQIAKFTQRPTLKVEDTNGTSLLTSVAKTFATDKLLQWPTELQFNPIRSNLENLSKEQFTKNLGTLFRAAEIVSGQKFSYREVWGIAARCLLGNLTRSVNSNLLEQHLVALQPTSNKPLELFKSLQSLAALRTHQALFGVEGAATTPKYEDLDVITGPMSKIDPLIDTTPGQFDPDQTDSGWSTWINDAFAGNDSSSSPLEALLAHSKAFENNDFELAITDFDLQLDKAFTNLIHSQDFPEKPYEEIVRWYSSYLTRLYAVSKGIPAFRSEIATWIDIWRFTPQIPGYLEKKFMTLLRPKLSGVSSNESFIPLFDSRTVAISTPPMKPKFAIKLNDLKAGTTKAGDNLMLVLEEHSTPVAEMLIDFDFLRSALVCGEDSLGASDVTSSTEPRLERLRSARLTPELIQKQNTFTILSNFGVEDVVISN